LSRHQKFFQLSRENVCTGEFPGLVLKIEKPKSSFLLFKNGNIICTGTRSEVDARNVIMKCIGELR